MLIIENYSIEKYSINLKNYHWKKKMFFSWADIYYTLTQNVIYNTYTNLVMRIITEAKNKQTLKIMKMTIY